VSRTDVPTPKRRLLGSGLWQQPDFRRFWVGQTISVFGDQISYVAIPLTAVITLDATASEMGILTFAGRLPWLVIGLFAGLWVDRLRRRPILMTADLVRSLLLLAIPLLAIANLLRIEVLYVIAVLAGILGVFFDVAWFAYLPTLVGRAQLVEGHSKLQVSANVAGVAGPSLAGVLVQLLTAPIAVLLDALSFLVSALALSLIRTPEPEVATPAERRGLRAELGEGLRYVVSNPLIRGIVAGGTIHNFANTMLMAVVVLYLTRELGIEPAVIGLIFAVFSAGALLGALVAGPVARRLGLGPATLIGQFVTAAGGMFYPLATGATPVDIALLMTGQFIWAFTRPIMNINLSSLMAGITPDHLMGRMTASRRFIMWGVMPLGGLAGGFLGEAIGLRETVVVVIGGEVLAGLVYALSPISRVREQPDVQPERLGTS
jgi:MFS family permease